MVEYGQIQAFFFVLMSLCGCVAAVAGTAAIVAKFWSWAHKQSDKNAEKLEEHETWFASDKRRIEKLELDQAEMQEQNKLTLRALDVLLRHEIDGNHTEQLQKVSKDIYDYLFENKSK